MIVTTTPHEALAQTTEAKDPAALGRTGVRRLPALAYAALFSLVLPLLLLLWMRRLDLLVALPPVRSVPLGAACCLAGGTLTILAIVSLWRKGGGLPMSPFPPRRLVSDGAYGLLAHPIYVGSVLLCAGVALLIASPAGVWVVTPVFAAAAAAFVMGYEREATLCRYGRLVRPRLALPLADDGQPTAWDRVSVYALVLVPWLLLYMAVEYLGVPGDSWQTYLPGEREWQVVPWSEAIYLLAYPLVVAVPLVARTRRDLRRFAVSGLMATAAIIPFYLLVPLVADARPIPTATAWAPLLRLERTGDTAATAFPAFHVIWTCVACEVYVARWRRSRLATSCAVFLAGAIGWSCVATGMHATLDVVAGFAAYGLLQATAWIWLQACKATEAIANSWREWRIGPIRFMSHGVYAAAGAALGVALGACFGGAAILPWMIATAVVAEVCAALWAQIVEGSSKLLRPYGYFGAVIGVIVMAGAARAGGIDPWRLLAAMSIAGCVTQVLGRLRCLVQGCCHGRVVGAAWGIRYRHARSRVVRLSDLGGRPVHPTQLYSMLWTLFTAAVLIRLWTVAVPLPEIAAAYLVLIGLGRFVEEHYRGEPQTAWVAGLRLYQWLAIVFVVGGAVVSCVSGAPCPSPGWVGVSSAPLLLLLAVLTYVAYGMDFPRSNRKFSRLV